MKSATLSTDALDCDGADETTSADVRGEADLEREGAAFADAAMRAAW